MVDISPTAVAEIERLKLNHKTSDMCLRLAVKPGGCLEFFYDLVFEPKEANNSEGAKGDHLLEINGVSLLVDDQSWQYIEYLKLDYAEDLMGGGFRFHNPQHQKICGCGISFAQSAQ